MFLIDNKDFCTGLYELWKRRQEDDTIEWQDVCDYINSALGTTYSRETIRKGELLLRLMDEAGMVNIGSEPTTSSLGVSDELLAIRKERIRLSDQRIELNRTIRQEARKESFLELVQGVIADGIQPMDIPVPAFDEPIVSDCDLLCHLTDIHTGIEIENFKNVFNEDVLRRRMGQYANRILQIAELHRADKCHVVIGEIVSGLIHSNLRLQNNLDLIEQFMLISELIAVMLTKLAKHFNAVFVYVTPGNHSRISPKKEEALDGENVDILLPFYLKARLQNATNISIRDNVIDPEIAMFHVRNASVFASHGHKDNPASVVQNFTMMFGTKPDIVLLGHRHTNGLTTVYDTKVIESGCVSGTDNYAMSIRKTNKPEQTVSVIGDRGLLCVYDVRLD